MFLSLLEILCLQFYSTPHNDVSRVCLAWAAGSPAVREAVCSVGVDQPLPGARECVGSAGLSAQPCLPAVPAKQPRTLRTVYRCHGPVV